MFVVPGWCGLELAQLFFEQTEGMKYGGKELFHACGLVFCHQQAPISRIAKLARALADKGKEANRDADSLNWLVLESFDHTGADFDAYLKQRFETSLTWADLALDPAAVNVLQKQFSSLKYDLPRSALIQVTRTLASPEKVGADKTAALTNRARQQVANAGGADQGKKDGFKALWKALHGTEWTTSESSDEELRTWIKLAELWDYCPDWNKNGAEQ